MGGAAMQRKQSLHVLTHLGDLHDTYHAPQSATPRKQTFAIDADNPNSIPKQSLKFCKLRMKYSVCVLFCVSCFCAVAGPASYPASARQLAEWRSGDANTRKQFDNYILASYKSLRAKHLVCPPKGRTDVANESAALLAAEVGVDQGLFDIDGPAMPAVADALGFWFPCPSQR